MRVNWTDPAFSGGELFETMVACLIQQDRPRSARVRIHRGDGGVDICDLVDGGWEIYQCKHFTGQIRWDQVEASLKKLADGEFLGRPVVRWSLVVPQEPTRKKLATFMDKTASSPFECQWFGTGRLDELAARFPHVGDYYLGDGRTRLEQLARDWSNVAALIAKGRAVSVEATTQPLSDLVESIGRNDPHFRYGLQVFPRPPSMPGDSPEGSLMSKVLQMGDQYVIYSLFPRYPAAVEDAADRVRFEMIVSEEAAARLDSLVELGGDGIRLSGPDLVRVRPPLESEDLPAETYELQVEPHVDRTPAAIRIAVEGNEGKQVVARLTRRSVTGGLSGATSTFETVGGSLALRTVADRRSKRIDVKFEGADLAGFSVAQLALDIDLLRSLREGASVVLAPEFGPLGQQGQRLGSDISNDLLLRMADALIAVQEHTTTELRFPESYTGVDVVEVERLARLLSGETVDGTWTSAEIVLDPGALEANGLNDLAKEWAVVIVHQLDTTNVLPDESIVLTPDQYVVRAFRAARASSVSPLDDGSHSVTLVPGSHSWLKEELSAGPELDQEQGKRLLRDTS